MDGTDWNVDYLSILNYLPHFKPRGKEERVQNINRTVAIDNEATH